MQNPRIGLALGGGGARGLAHIPVLEAFDDLGLKPAAIAGTSIGSIFGAAYASGLSGQALRGITLETLGDRNAVLGRLWKLRPRKFNEWFDGSMAQFDPLKVLKVFIAEHLSENFENLEIPLQVLATDFYGCREYRFCEGPLLPAIAASIAIPAIFKPVRHEDVVLVDGGVTNPLPFDVLPEDLDLIVAVDVVGVPVPRPGRHLPGSVDAIFGTTQILMQTITTEKLKSRAPGILIQPEHDNIRVLDFLKSRQILDSAEPLRAQTRSLLTAAIEAM